MNAQDMILSIYQKMTAGGDLDALLRLFEKGIGNPVLIADCNLRTLAHTKRESLQDPTWQKLLSEEYDTHMELAEEITKAGFAVGMQNANNPLLLNGEPLGHRWLTGIITHDRKFLGYILVMEYDKPFQDSDGQRLAEFCSIVGYYIAVGTQMEALRDPGTDLLLHNLFTGVHTDKKIIRDVLFSKFDLPGYVMDVLVISGDPDTGNLCDLPHMLGMLSHRFPVSRGLFYNGCAVLLRHYLPEKDRADYTEIARVLKEQKLFCGISRPFSDPGRTAEHYRQAATALDISRRLLVEKRLCYYDDIAVYDLLDKSREGHAAPALDSYCSSSIDRILAYDRRYSTNCFRDLYVYYACGSDIRTAAELLGIHRNTMHYRIGRVEAIIGKALNDPNLEFQLRLSMRILYFNDPTGFRKQFDIPDDMLPG